MDARNKLLDKAKEACAASSDAALADRLVVSRQQISRWRKAHDPMPGDWIAKIARAAHQDPGEWLLLIESEQAHGEARKAYSGLVKRLGIAALLAVLSVPGMAGNFAENGSQCLLCQFKAGVNYCRRRLAWFLSTLARRSESYAPLPAL